MIFNTYINTQIDIMAAISLNLPDDLAQESKMVAEQIGITRTELIRQALRHELDQIKARMERLAMAEAIQAMKQDPEYLRESEELDAGLTEALPNEKDAWWQKQS